MLGGSLCSNPWFQRNTRHRNTSENVCECQCHSYVVHRLYSSHSFLNNTLCLKVCSPYTLIPQADMLPTVILLLWQPTILHRNIFLNPLPWWLFMFYVSTKIGLLFTGNSFTGIMLLICDQCITWLAVGHWLRSAVNSLILFPKTLDPTRSTSTAQMSRSRNSFPPVPLHRNV